MARDGRQRQPVLPPERESFNKLGLWDGWLRIFSLDVIDARLTPSAAAWRRALRAWRRRLAKATPRASRLRHHHPRYLELKT